MNHTPFTPQEIASFRSDTKGTDSVIHLNNAGASLPPDVVNEAIVSFLQEEAQYGGYETEAKYKTQLDHTHTLIAQLINAGADEIALVENASAAWDIAFHGMNLQAGDEVITSEMEYASNVLGLVSAQLRGVKIIVINNDAQGNFPLRELEDAITPQTKLIAVTHIPSTAGNVLPVVAIGMIAQKHRITYLLDAAQSIGQVPLDVKQIGCDILVTTGRKFLRGPRGTAFLYVKKEIQDTLQLFQMDGRTVTDMSQQNYIVRADAKRFEWHEKNHAVQLGFQKAIAYALNIGIDRIWQRNQYIATYTRNALRNLPGVTVHDQGDDLCGIVTFSVASIDAAQVRATLAEHHINVTIGFAKSTLYYMNRKQLDVVVRASVHYYNTEQEIDKLCEVIATLL